MKLAVVTTFNKIGMEQYGQRMIDSFHLNWPNQVQLYVYAENCTPITNAEMVVIDPISAISELQEFKNKWRDVPKANGVCPWPAQRPLDHFKKFKWDAVKFSHKVFSIAHCYETFDFDYLLWMDADTICHSPISMPELEGFMPTDADICYLGRKNKWPECGLYALNRNSKNTAEFVSRFKHAYTDAERGIFKMAEWHDSFVFEEVRKTMDLNCLNWSDGIIDGEGHPLINSRWGAYLDHLKGDRKISGSSSSKDLKQPRTETYWKHK